MRKEAIQLRGKSILEVTDAKTKAQGKRITSSVGGAAGLKLRLHTPTSRIKGRFSEFHCVRHRAPSNYLRRLYLFILIMRSLQADLRKKACTYPLWAGAIKCLRLFWELSKKFNKSYKIVHTRWRGLFTLGNVSTRSKRREKKQSAKLSLAWSCSFVYNTCEKI